MNRSCTILIAVALLLPFVGFADIASGQPAPVAGGAGDGPPIDLTCVGTSAPPVVHVRAGVPSDLGGLSPLDTRYEWDFGDPGSRYNQPPGWNAAHVYDKPGTYTITLTVRLAFGDDRFNLLGDVLNDARAGTIAALQLAAAAGTAVQAVLHMSVDDLGRLAA